MEFKIGDKVIFGRGQGVQTCGTITGIGRTGKFKVRQDEARGRYPVGSIWTVPAESLRVDDGSVPVPQSHPGRPSAAHFDFKVGDRVFFTRTRGSRDRIEGTISQINRTTVTLVDTSDHHPVGWLAYPSMLTRIGTAPLPAKAIPTPSPYRPGDLIRVETLFGEHRADRGGRGYGVHTVTATGHEPGRGNVVEVDGWRRVAESIVLGKHDVQRRPLEEVLLNIRGAYSHLSPENLTADGERRRSEVNRLAAGLHRWLRFLFREAGRKVSEDEAYAALEVEQPRTGRRGV